MRQELLAATERGLAEIAQRVTRGTLHGAGQIGLAVGPAVKRYRDQINSQSALDGVYVLRSSVPAPRLLPGCPAQAGARALG